MNYGFDAQRFGNLEKILSHVLVFCLLHFFSDKATLKKNPKNYLTKMIMVGLELRSSALKCIFSSPCLCFCAVCCFLTAVLWTGQKYCITFSGFTVVICLDIGNKTYQISTEMKSCTSVGTEKLKPANVLENSPTCTSASSVALLSHLIIHQQT